MQWNENFENLMEKALCEEKEIYVLGDFNRDLLNTKIKEPWLDFMEEFGLFQKFHSLLGKQTILKHLLITFTVIHLQM